jgi:hypothetical protein
MIYLGQVGRRSVGGREVERKDSLSAGSGVFKTSLKKP